MTPAEGVKGKQTLLCRQTSYNAFTGNQRALFHVSSPSARENICKYTQTYALILNVQACRKASQMDTAFLLSAVQKRPSIYQVHLCCVLPASSGIHVPEEETPGEEPAAIPMNHALEQKRQKSWVSESHMTKKDHINQTSIWPCLKINCHLLPVLP